MDLFELTRALVDIESITGNEEKAGDFLFAYVSDLAARTGGRAERMAVEPHRFNVFAQWGERPVVTLSTHYDTVPPFFASQEDEDWILGRASADTKGIVAAMLKAAEALVAEPLPGLGVLFVVGEERNSAGAVAASRDPRGSEFLINGEPTENKLALGSKGALRYEITARGRMAHSAYPELGDSAIHKLLDALAEIRAIELPVDEVLGPGSLNVGTISGGRAPNVVADEAQAEIMFRLVADGQPIREAVERAAEGRVEACEILCVPAVRLGAAPGFATTVVAYTTDIPSFGGAWGRPFLIGPGSIHVAHTLEERVEKRQLVEAVELYQRLVKQLWKERSK